MGTSRKQQFETRRLPGESAQDYQMRRRQRMPGETPEEHGRRLARMDANVERVKNYRNKVVDRDADDITNGSVTKDVMRTITSHASITSSNDHVMLIDLDHPDVTYSQGVAKSKKTREIIGYFDEAEHARGTSNVVHVTHYINHYIKSEAVGEGGDYEVISPPSLPHAKDVMPLHDTKKEEAAENHVMPTQVLVTHGEQAATANPGDPRVEEILNRLQKLETVFAATKTDIFNTKESLSEEIKLIRKVDLKLHYAQNELLETKARLAVFESSLTSVLSQEPPAAPPKMPGAKKWPFWVQPDLLDGLVSGYQLMMADYAGARRLAACRELSEADEAALEETFRHCERCTKPTSAGYIPSVVESDAFSHWTRWVRAFAEGPGKPDEKTPAKFLERVEEFERYRTHGEFYTTKEHVFLEWMDRRGGVPIPRFVKRAEAALVNG